MALEQVFGKTLTETDVNYRLSFPTEHLEILPQVESQRDPVEFSVTCGDKVYRFRCIKRQQGSLKPVIESGWSDVVREKGVQVGDQLAFYEVKGNHEQPTRYSIEVSRRVPRYSDTEEGTTYFWQRIV